MTFKNQIFEGNTFYKLLDSGNGKKLEEFSGLKVIRPEKQALWNVSNPTLWENVDAEFTRDSDKYGNWKFKNEKPSKLTFQAANLKLNIQFTPFGHIGVFPEQSSEWEWIQKKIMSTGRKLQVLSLFSYTGGATLAAAAAGANVVHVDASKPAITWAVENQKLSGLVDKPIRWMVDDALKFVKRECRRGNTYDGIIMDPPKFGRGPKGEVWQFEKDFPELLHACQEILSKDKEFFLVTAYAIPVSPITLGNMLSDIFQNGETAYGELGIVDSFKRVLPTAFYAKWSK